MGRGQRGVVVVGAVGVGAMPLVIGGRGRGRKGMELRLQVQVGGLMGLRLRLREVWREGRGCRETGR